MKTYGQFCPLAQATQLLCERWTFLIIREFVAGGTRFSDIQKGVPLISPTLLSTRLKQLTDAGVLERKKSRDSSTYRLTKAGSELKPVIELLGAWGHRWVRTQLSDDDLDAGLLMWDMRRSVDPGVFPAQRIIVQFNYAGAPKGASDWWLVSENGEIELCMNDPGHEVDIYITCSLRTMTKIWTCQQEFRDAVRNNEIKVMGDPRLTDRLQEWLRSSLLSRLGTLPEMPTLTWPPV